MEKCVIKTYRNYLKELEEILKSRYYGIRRRCNSPKCPAYKYYGGRDIQNKFNSFDEFFDYIVNELNILDAVQIENLQIDRIDNDGNYEPGNIRFVTPHENMKNR